MSQQIHDSEQPILTHLLELRDRLLRMVAGVFAVLLCLLPFANGVYSQFAQPLIAHMPASSSMIAIDVISPFLTPLKLCLVMAIFLAMPWILYQVWAFVAPGLYPREKQYALPLVAASTALFYAGMAFAYWVILPVFFAFLTTTAPQGVAVMTDINHYLDFVLTIFFAFGVCFEVPVATVVLVLFGVMTADQLAAKRPYVVVGAFVVGAVLTPPDVISQTLLAVPMWMLFEIGVYIARLIERRRAATPADRKSVV